MQNRAFYILVHFFSIFHTVKTTAFRETWQNDRRQLQNESTTFRKHSSKHLDPDQSKNQDLNRFWFKQPKLTVSHALGTDVGMHSQSDVGMHSQSAV